MNIAGVAGFPTPVATPKRTTSALATDETEPSRRTAGTPSSSAEFTAFLNMLVGTDAKLRSDLLKQLPADGAGLLDHLLSGAVEGTSTDAASALAPEGVPAGMNTVATPTAPVVHSSSDAATALNNATDAARYGMLTNRATPIDTNNGIINPSAPVTTGQSRITPAVLARIASRKTASVEELLAVGDREGALARAKLDDLLAKAGTVEGISIADATAVNSALAAALAASAADVGTPVRDMEAIDPELRARFERVAERMKNEYGHDVTVVETARSQERQDHLYAQGRTTTGSVVTWTTDSLHTHGEALDVIVDGTWTNPTGFARLQQIAKEEGLGTLGMRDPGHLELPRESWSNAWTNNADVRVTSSVTSAGNNGVARVATVARVASVASAGNAGRATTLPQPTLQNTPVNASLGLVAGAANTNSNSASPEQNTNSNTNTNTSRDSRNDHTRYASPVVDVTTEKSAARPAANDREKSGTQNALPVFGGTSSTNFIGPVDEVARPAGATAAEAAERVEGINAMRQQQGSKPLSQLTMEVDGPNGSTQQITVEVRGNSVGTHISTDGVSADRLRSNVNELKTGLEGRGLESDSVRISSQGARPADAADQVKAGTAGDREAARLTGAGASANSGGSEGATQQQRDRSSAARDWEDRQATRDEQRAQQERTQRDSQNPGRRGGSSQEAQDAKRPQYQEKR